MALLKRVGPTGIEDGANGRTDGLNPPEGFGLNSLYPREFFIRDERVHAPPDDLGRQIGGGLASGEATRVVQTLLDGIQTTRTTLDDLPSRVMDAIGSLTSRGLNPLVVILNSWQAVGRLSEMGIKPEAAVPTEPLANAPRLTKADAPLVLRYVGDAHLCLVADFERLIRIRHARPQRELNGDLVVGDERLLIGLQDLTEEGARRLLHRSADLGGQFESDAQAVQKLRTRVRVRVVESIAVDLLDASAGVGLVLDTDW